MEEALEHLKTTEHKHKSACFPSLTIRARRYVIDNCTNQEVIERKKKQANERKEKW